MRAGDAESAEPSAAPYDFNPPGPPTSATRDEVVAGFLRAKTGSLRQVSSLAGHVVGAGGRLLTFAYVQNGTGRGHGSPLQDALGHLLVATPSQ